MARLRVHFDTEQSGHDTEDAERSSHDVESVPALNHRWFAEDLIGTAELDQVVSRSEVDREYGCCDVVDEDLIFTAARTDIEF